MKTTSPTNSMDKMKEVRRKHNLRKRYSMTIEEYDAIFFSQGGVCAICENQEKSVWCGVLKRLAVDHNHKTGKIRGLLCNRCNAILAKMEDNPTYFERAASYLKND